MKRFKDLNKKLTIKNKLNQKLTECLIATSYYQSALDERKAEYEKMTAPNYTPKYNFDIAMCKDSFLQDSMLFAAHRMMIWLKLYRDNYSIKRTGLEELLAFQGDLKQLRDIRTHDYDYSLVSSKNKNNVKVQENYKNYIVSNQLGEISPFVTYTLENSSGGDKAMEDQHNIGGRFRFDLFKAAVEKVYKKTREMKFWEFEEFEEYISLETKLTEVKK